MILERIAPKSLFTAVLAAAALVGCSESSVAPTRLLSSTPAFALGDITTNAVQTGVFKICKTGNTGGTFTIARTLVGGDVLGTIQSPITVANGECRIAGLDGSGSGIAELVTPTENAAANTVQTLTGCTDGAVTFNPCVNLEINTFHGAVVTYNNVFTPPPSTGCTFTKGYYRNHENKVLAEDGRSLSSTQQILEATPGQPGNVTFQDDNLLLNLYQQLLTALINLNGKSAPAAVAAAIATVEAGTGNNLSGTIITSTLTQQQESDLTDILTSFNQGEFTGWPSCD
jgi:hypothetical protein